jgi:hypothetical protein
MDGVYISQYTYTTVPCPPALLCRYVLSPGYQKHHLCCATGRGRGRWQVHCFGFTAVEVVGRACELAVMRVVVDYVPDYAEAGTAVFAD